MNTVLLVLSLLIIGSLTIGFLILKKRLDQFFEAKKQDQTALLLQQQIQHIVQTLDTRLGQSHQLLQSQFGTSTKIIQDVTDRLAKLDETNRQVVGFATQLQNLQDVLQNPKQRGILGEYFLESVLKNVLPPDSYSLQHRFQDGEIVDAVVRVKDKLIPIDSKFSLENYNRITEERDQLAREKYEKLFKQDLKNRIDETSKYIRPQEGTMDFAFMFIPAEGIYYDLLINKVGVLKVNTADLIEYAFRQKRVIIVSPTSFFAYLQTVLQGLRALQIEESAKEIRTRVESLGKHLITYEEYLKKLGVQLGTTVNTYNLAYKEFSKVDKDVMKITGNGNSRSEVMQLEKPLTE